MIHEVGWRWKLSW